MLRLSSNWTLVLKIALPVFYISFFGLFVLAVFMVEKELWPLYLPSFRIGLVTTYILFILLLRYTVMRLRRVEYSGMDLIVSNYFKTYRYRVEDVEAIHTYNLLLIHLARVTLKTKGVWGRRIYFVAKTVNVETFMHQFPHFRKPTS